MAEETPQASEDKPEEQAPKTSEEKPAGEAAAPKAEAKSEDQVKAAALSPKKQVAIDAKGSIWMSRRNFFSRAGWAAFFAFVGSMLVRSCVQTRKMLEPGLYSQRTTKFERN